MIETAELPTDIPPERLYGREFSELKLVRSGWIEGGARTEVYWRLPGEDAGDIHSVSARILSSDYDNVHGAVWFLVGRTDVPQVPDTTFDWVIVDDNAVAELEAKLN